MVGLRVLVRVRFRATPPDALRWWYRVDTACIGRLRHRLLDVKHQVADGESKHDGDEDTQIEVRDIAWLVREVYPNFSHLSTIKMAYQASEGLHKSGSMSRTQFRNMLPTLVLFNNEARTFDGAS